MSERGVTDGSVSQKSGEPAWWGGGGNFHLRAGVGVIHGSVVGRAGSCLTLRKELSKETCAEQARDFIGKGHPGGEQ